MLTMVSAQTARGDTLLLPLTDASAGYSVKDIQGLDPVKAAIVSSSIAQLDGAHLQNTRREPRNITMKLGLEADYVTSTVPGLRTRLYSYFSPKSLLTFGLYSDDNLFGTTEAVVESCENNMFTQDPEVDISLICMDPDIYAPEVTTLGLLTVDDATSNRITYNGTSDTGIVFRITFPYNSNGVRLQNTRADMVVQIMDINGTFVPGDELVVSTIPGSKSVIKTTAGIGFSVLNYLDRDSAWISLAYGDNLFRAYSGEVAIRNLPCTLEYQTKYEGF